MLPSSVTLCMTLVMLSPPVVHNSVPREEITCRNLSCDRLTSANCPLWHFCNPRTGQCSPCGSCRDAEDNANYESAPPNCRDPMYCVANYEFLPQHVCPRLKVREGSECSGNCAPCQGTFGYFLGTVCRFNCADGDSDVFACIFLNEIAQWNITRTPRWLEVENATPPPGLSHHSQEKISDRPVSVQPEVHDPSTSSPKGAEVHSNSMSGFSTTVLVSAISFVVVVAAVVVVVATAISRRQKRPKSPEAIPMTEIGRIVEEERGETPLDSNTAPDNNNNNRTTEQPTPRRSREPDEVSYHSVDIIDDLEEDSLVVQPQIRRNAPTENSDTHCSAQSTVQPEKNLNFSSCFDWPSSGSQISLRTERGDSPQTPRSHPNQPLVIYPNATHRDKVDNQWCICYDPPNVGEETLQKHVQ